MCKGFARAVVAALVVCGGSGEAADISGAGEMATAAASPGAASGKAWLAQLVRESGLPAEQDGSAFLVAVDVGGEPISLMVRSERVAPVGEREQVLSIWSTLLCVDDETTNSPALARALAKVAQSAGDRVSARQERGQLVVVYESTVPSRGMTSAGLRQLLEADASTVQRALHLLRGELARPSAGG